MTPKRQGMIGHNDRRHPLTGIGLDLAGLKLRQRLVKLTLQFDAVTLALNLIVTPNTPRLYHVQNVASYHFIIWVIFHAKACFTPPTQPKVGAAHIQTSKR
jgi:hypothetical protein